MQKVTYLHHSLWGNRAGTRGRFLLRDEGIPRLVVTIWLGIQQLQGGRVVLEGTNVADEGGQLHLRHLSLSQRIVAVGMRDFVGLVGVPLS